MPELLLVDAVQATGGKLMGTGSASFRGASLDSRSVPDQGLFIAIHGEHADGHDFVTAAFAHGAAAALVSREVSLPDGRTLLLVPDVPAALLALGRFVRLREGWRTVAITGSIGKTTTKQIAATLLEGAGPLWATPGNRNGQLGIPESILNAPAGARLWVAECGMSFPGELGRLAPVVAPEIVVYTNVAAVHLGNFRSIDEIEEAKEELILGAGADATIVANADDPRTRAIALRHPGRRFLFGIDGDADLAARDLVPSPDSIRFRLEERGGSQLPVDLPLAGRHNVSNFLAAASAALLLGIPLAEIAAKAAAIRPASRRGERVPLPSGALLVDESYNSSPRALEASAEAFGGLAAGKGRRIGILGEMRELGPDSLALHRETGRRIAPFFDELVAVGGADARALVEGAREGGLEPKATRLLPTPESAAASVVERLGAGDRILLKGSRGVALERALPALGLPASGGKTS
jgi:UDP-N-acetylmuramoyl-tripeptide--D-alanyl-D-alanine ligase